MGYDEDNAPSASAPKKGHGCFFWGCITSIIIVVVGIAVIGGGGYYLWRTYLIGPLKAYSETTPAVLPEVSMPEPERKALHARVDAFNEATKKGDPVEPLVLTADDLNVLVDDNPDLKGKAHFDIKGDQVKAEICFPLKVLNLSSELNDRYINGSATLRATLLNGTLDVRADSIETKGKALPAEFVKALQGQNLAQNSNNDPKQRESLERIESMVIKDGKIFLTPKNAKKSADEPKGEAPAAEAPKVEAPKGEAPAEAPKVEAPKAEAPAPPAEAPKVEAPKPEAPKAEAPAPPAEAPKPEAPKGDAPPADAPKTPETL